MTFVTATTMPLLIALAEIGLRDGVMLPSNAAALVGAGVVSVLCFRPSPRSSIAAARPRCGHRRTRCRLGPSRLLPLARPVGARGALPLASPQCWPVTAIGAIAGAAGAVAWNRWSSLLRPGVTQRGRGSRAAPRSSLRSGAWPGASLRLVRSQWDQRPGHSAPARIRPQKVVLDRVRAAVGRALAAGSSVPVRRHWLHPRLRRHLGGATPAGSGSSPQIAVARCRLDPAGTDRGGEPVQHRPGHIRRLCGIGRFAQLPHEQYPSDPWPGPLARLIPAVLVNAPPCSAGARRSPAIRCRADTPRRPAPPYELSPLALAAGPTRASRARYRSAGVLRQH